MLLNEGKIDSEFEKLLNKLTSKTFLKTISTTFGFSNIEGL